MFGMPNLQIYGLQQNVETHGMKVTTSNFLEKLIKGEVLAGTDVNRREFGDPKRNLVGIVPNNNNTHYNNNNNNNIIINNNNTNNTNNNHHNNTSSNDSALESESADGDSIVTVNADTNKSEDNDSGRRTTVPSEILDRNSNQVIHETTETTTTKPNNNNNRNKLNNKTTDRKLLTNDMQRKKFIQMISFLDQQNQRLEKELAKEKKRRAEELSRIIKSLLCFEAKLKHDKKVINHQLYAKDTEISKLISLNRVLRKKCGAIDDFETIMNDYDKDALFCPNCRKEFYGIDFKENWTQTNKDGRIIQDDHTEHGSSSDETLSSSFYGARRSIRYTSKRTFGTFRDYMRSRCLSIDDNNLDNSEENASTLSRDESQYSYEKMNAYSRAIDRLHGVRRVGSFDADLDSENDTQRRNFSSGPDDEHSPHDEEDIFLLGKTHSCSRVREFSESSPKQEFETSTDDWYASASDADDADVRAKPYAYNAVNPVLECVNQILLQQSMEESLHDGPPSLDSNENNSGSGSGGSNKDGTVSRKRVHFSTKNSMVHVPRDDSSSPTNIMGNSDSKDNSFNYESIYSNEYEPIGSEHNSSNLYVDMESKLSHDDRIIVQDRPKQPPALPPKPANLMKFKRVLRIVPQSCPLKEEEINLKQDEKTISEPDYCSISEVNEAITSVQIVADVHKVPEDESSSSVQDDALSQKTDEVEEIFADIPKLPNVAAIIAPKAISKFISHDNYITKSPSPKEEISQHKPPPYVPNILAEINRKISTSTPTTPTKPTVLPQSPSKKSPAPLRVINSLENKLPLQAEFDWYNLDAEYGKSNQPDVIKATDVTNLDFHSEELDAVAEGNEHHVNHGVEYNLDEEFSLVNQPDIIKENILEPMLGPAATVCDGFPTIVDQTPCAVQKVKVKTNFTNFIDSSGLSTKPLPRQRKIYFSGPFV